MKVISEKEGGAGKERGTFGHKTSSYWGSSVDATQSDNKA